MEIDMDFIVELVWAGTKIIFFSVGAFTRRLRGRVLSKSGDRELVVGGSITVLFVSLIIWGCLLFNN
jgi:hypothetical protein